MPNLASFLIAITGLLSIGAGVIATFRKGKSEDSATVSAALVERASLKQRIDQQIDERVSAELTRQGQLIDALRTEVDELKGDLKKERRRNGSIKRVVQRWFYELRSWDSGGRHGKLPMPSDEDMMLLELDRDPSDDDDMPPALVQPMRDIVAQHEADTAAGL